MELIKDKDSAMEKAKRTKKDADWIKAKQLRNNCLPKVRRAKKDFINSELDNNKEDSNKFWKNIHDVIPNSKKSQKHIQLFHSTRNTVVPEKDTAMYINSYFVNIGPNLAKEFNSPWYYEGPVAAERLYDIETTEEEVL